MSPHACARCGRQPRVEQTFLCRSCLADPETLRQAKLAELHSPDPRKYVIERYHWAGGWPKA